MAARWRLFLTGLSAGVLWGAVWVSALAVPFCDWRVIPPLAALAWLSAVILAAGRHHGRGLLLMAAMFLLLWSLIIGGIRLLDSNTSLRPVLNLAVWLGLGLNLMLAKTPLGLALPLARYLEPLLGRLRAQKLALALALLAHLIPGFLAAGFNIAKTVKRRAGGVSFFRRLALWGRAMTREAVSQSDELARTLLKRWPW